MRSLTKERPFNLLCHNRRVAKRSQATIVAGQTTNTKETNRRVVESRIAAATVGPFVRYHAMNDRPNALSARMSSLNRRRIITGLAVSLPIVAVITKQSDFVGGGAWGLGLGAV